MELASKKNSSFLTNSEKGLTLLELLMVVSTIGVLAAIAIPQYRNFVVKTKQQEGKVLMSRYYTSQILFHQEWRVYHPDFRNILFHPTGRLIYHLSLTNRVTITPEVPSDYTGPGQKPGVNPPSADSRYWNTYQYCRLSDSDCIDDSKTNFFGGMTVSEYRRHGISPEQDEFLVMFVGNLDNDYHLDHITMDQNKNIVHVKNDMSH